MAGNFYSTVVRFTDKYKRRMDYTAKKATLDVCNDARDPIAMGGRMPVDTSNLLHSMAAAIGNIPSGPILGNETKTGDDVAAQLIRWKPGTKLFFAGFTANYARQMEYRYGYMRGAVMKWEFYVNRAAEEAKRKIR